MFNNNQRKGLKAWVRYDGNNNAVAGSLIFQKDKPKVGNWKEYMDVNLCCPITTTTTTTLTPTTTTTTTTINPNTTILQFTRDDNFWAEGEVIELPYVLGGTYTGTISWNGGEVISPNSYYYRSYTVSISTFGPITVIITGIIEGFNYNNLPPFPNYNISILRWGSLRDSGSSNAFMFRNTYLKDINTPDLPNLSGITDLTSMFEGCPLNGTISPNINSWDTSSVQNMSYMFSNTQFNQNIGNWDVSNVTAMDGMFYNAQNFDQDLSGWCVTNIPSAPPLFDDNATSWLLPRPVWGTCPP